MIVDGHVLVAIAAAFAVGLAFGAVWGWMLREEGRLKD